MRRIDGKFHIENNQIVKTSNGDPIPEDEPLFMIRARDRLALPLLQSYFQISMYDGCNDYHRQMLENAIEEFKKFKELHPERMKQPSITRGL